MIFDFTTILILCVGILLLLWYSIIIGYMYPMIGNSDDYSTYSFSGNPHLTGMILGVSMLGCLAIAGGVSLLSAVWLNPDIASILTIIMSVLALGASITAVSVASFTH
jgi:hypothetical protein